MATELESGLYAFGAPPIEIWRMCGHLDTDVSQAYRIFEGPWDRHVGRRAVIEEPIEMAGIGMPLPLTRRQVFKVAQVQSYEPALRLLAKLYDKVMLPDSSLDVDQNGEVAIAVGMLAAAGLCEASPAGVRLSPEGKDFVELLAESEMCLVAEE